MFNAPEVGTSAMPKILAQGSATEAGNNPILWVLACAVLGVIVLQSVVYILAVRRNAVAADMTQKEVATAFRTGAIAAIGPSLAVVLIAVAMLPLFGTPPVLVRIGLIGSAAAELASASAAAGTMNAELGGAGYDQNVFVVALAAMSLSGACWMIATLILTPVLYKGEAKLLKVNPAIMSVIPTAALLGAFAALGMQEVQKSSAHVVAIAISALIMAILLWIAKVKKQHWLNEWALGFAMLGGLVAAVIAHNSGLTV